MIFIEQLSMFDEKEEYQPRFQAYLNYSGKTHLRKDKRTGVQQPVKPSDYYKCLSKNGAEFRE